MLQGRSCTRQQRSPCCNKDPVQPNKYIYMYFLNGKSLKKKKKKDHSFGRRAALGASQQRPVSSVRRGAADTPLYARTRDLLPAGCGKGRWAPFWKGYRRARWGAYARIFLLPLAPKIEQTQETVAPGFIHQVITERPRGAPFCTLELPWGQTQ